MRRLAVDSARTPETDNALWLSKRLAPPRMDAPAASGGAVSSTLRSSATGRVASDNRSDPGRADGSSLGQSREQRRDRRRRIVDSLRVADDRPRSRARPIASSGAARGRVPYPDVRASRRAHAARRAAGTGWATRQGASGVHRSPRATRNRTTIPRLPGCRESGSCAAPLRAPTAFRRGAHAMSRSATAPVIAPVIIPLAANFASALDHASRACHCALVNGASPGQPSAASQSDQVRAQSRGSRGARAGGATRAEALMQRSGRIGRSARTTSAHVTWRRPSSRQRRSTWPRACPLRRGIGQEWRSNRTRGRGRLDVAD